MFFKRSVHTVLNSNKVRKLYNRGIHEATVEKIMAIRILSTEASDNYPSTRLLEQNNIKLDLNNFSNGNNHNNQFCEYLHKTHIDQCMNLLTEQNVQNIILDCSGIRCDALEPKKQTIIAQFVLQCVLIDPRITHVIKPQLESLPLEFKIMDITLDRLPLKWLKTREPSPGTLLQRCKSIFVPPPPPQGYPLPELQAYVLALVTSCVFVDSLLKVKDVSSETRQKWKTIHSQYIINRSNEVPPLSKEAQTFLKDYILTELTYRYSLPNIQKFIKQVFLYLPTKKEEVRYSILIKDDQGVVHPARYRK